MKNLMRWMGRKLSYSMGGALSFTLIELMIVVTIVAILALIAIPLYSANTTAAVMSEGVSGAGTVRTALRVYASANGGYAGATMEKIGVNGGDLEGKYFAQGDYSLSGVTSSTYTIRVGPPSKSNRPNMPYYTVNQDGLEQGAWYTNQ